MHRQRGLPEVQRHGPGSAGGVEGDHVHTRTRQARRVKKKKFDASELFSDDFFKPIFEEIIHVQKINVSRARLHRKRNGRRKFVPSLLVATAAAAEPKEPPPTLLLPLLIRLLFLCGDVVFRVKTHRRHRRGDTLSKRRPPPLAGVALRRRRGPGGGALIHRQPEVVRPRQVARGDGGAGAEHNASAGE